MTDRPKPARMDRAEFQSLRIACGLTQRETANLIGMQLLAVQRYEDGQRAVAKVASDALLTLDELIRARVDSVLAPLLRKPPSGPVLLVRYRTAEEYEAGEPKHAAAGLPFAAHAALVCRVMDGLSRLGIKYAVRWRDDIAADEKRGSEAA